MRDLECPYFQRDPRLDPPELPQPGWLFDIELGIMGSHVVDKLGEPPFPNGITVPFPVSSVPMARLDWTVSPRFELGYRLPSGFGEIGVAYRFLSAEGTGSTIAGSVASPDAAATLNSRLEMNMEDLDYSSRETSLGPDWGMKWRIGLRLSDVFFESRPDEPIASVPPGGHFERNIFDNFSGVGPHLALELSKRRNSWGLGWLGRLDGGLLFGHVSQRFGELSSAARRQRVVRPPLPRAGADAQRSVGTRLAASLPPQPGPLYRIHRGILVERGPDQRPGRLQRS